MFKNLFSSVSFFTLIFFSQLSNAQNYDPNFFPIGVWSVRGDFRPVNEFLFNVETAASFHHENFSLLKSKKFNAAFLSYDPITPTLDTILDIAELNDLKIISPMQNLYQLISNNISDNVSDAMIINALVSDRLDLQKNSTATLGYYLYDEPLPNFIDFDLLARCKNILQAETNTAPHPILSTFNLESVMSYIESYINLDVMMMDAYPFEDGDAIGDISDYMPDYFVDGDPMPLSDYIDTVRVNHCDATNKPLWAVIQSFGDMETPANGGYWRQVYPKEIRLQVYIAVMQGAKGIWYFLFESEYPYLLGMLDISGQPSLRLLEAESVNQEIEALSSTLLKLKVINDFTSVTASSGEIRLHEDISSSFNEKYVIAVNTNVNEVSNPNVVVQKNSIGYEVESIVDVYTNSPIAFTETANTYEFNPTIDIASGRVFKLSNQNLGFTENIDNINFLLYPNPAKTKINISIDDIKTIEKILIFNVLGQELFNNSVNSNSISIDVSNWSKGIYYATIKTENNRNVTKKFVVE